MFNSLFSLGGLVGMYSGSSLVAAVSDAAFKVNNYGPMMNNGSSDSTIALMFAILAPLFIFLWLLCLAVGVFMIISWWKVFEKAGRPGWAAIIPIYNLVVMFQIVGMSPWLILLNIIPFVGSLIFFIVSIFMNIKLAKAFGKDGGFAVGLILVPVVFVPMLAFGQAKFVGLAPTAPSGPVLPQNPLPPVTPASTV